MEMNPGALPIPAGCRNRNFLVPRSFLAMAAEIGIEDWKNDYGGRVSGTEDKYRPKEGARTGPRPWAVLVAWAHP